MTNYAFIDESGRAYSMEVFEVELEFGDTEWGCVLRAIRDGRLKFKSPITRMFIDGGEVNPPDALHRISDIYLDSVSAVWEELCCVFKQPCSIKEQ